MNVIDIWENLETKLFNLCDLDNDKKITQSDLDIFSEILNCDNIYDEYLLAYELSELL